MNYLRVARSRIAGFLRKETLEQEIDEELRFHLAMRAQENVARGMSPARSRAGGATGSLATSTASRMRGAM